MSDGKMATCDKCQDQYDTEDGYCLNCNDESVVYSDKAHTPTPWIDNFVDGVHHLDTDDGTMIGRLESLNPSAEANAKHIVKCVNMHDELVGIISKLLGTTELNLDEMESETRSIVVKASGLLADLGE
jgi:uncharacterized Zn ribbon protein